MKPPKNERPIWSYPILTFNFSLFTLWSFISPLFTIPLIQILLWHAIFYSYVIWVLNWQFTNLPLTLELILDFSYFIFRIILFLKNIHLLLLYPKHVIKLLGYNLGCYTTRHQPYSGFVVNQLGINLTRAL